MPDQVFRGPPLVLVERYADQRGVRHVFVVLRTVRPLPLLSNGDVNATIAVNGQQSLDAVSQIARKSRHCYRSNSLESAVFRTGQRVEVVLRAPRGVRLARTVTVRKESRKILDQVGCGGRKR